MKLLKTILVSVSYGSLSLVIMAGVVSVLPTSLFVTPTDLDVTQDSRLVRVSTDVFLPTKVEYSLMVYRDDFEIRRCSALGNHDFQSNTKSFTTQMSCDLTTPAEYEVEICLVAVDIGGLEMSPSCKSEEIVIVEDTNAELETKIESLQIQLEQVQRMVRP